MSHNAEREAEIRLEVVKLLKPNPANTKEQRDSFIETADKLAGFILKGQKD